MAVDYAARKAAKKSRRSAGDALKPRRERKKKQARRLCRGPCYGQPELSAQDVEPEGGDDCVQQKKRAPVGELAHVAQLSFGASGVAAKGPHAAGGERKQAPQASAAAALGGTEAAASGGKKRRRLSTAVNLLDARTAKTQAPRQGRLPLAAVSEELQALPDLAQRFMAGEGFAELMPIQSRCWPVLLAGRDVEAVAEPGSGKTLAYIVPAAVLLAGKGHGAGTTPDGPLALVLVPTRELAQQVAGVCRALRKHSGLRSCCVTGGADKQQQVQALAKRPHIVVATPGRLLDLAQEGALALVSEHLLTLLLRGRVRLLVLDEADKMLGLGFAPQLEQLRQLLAAPAPARVEGGAAPRRRRVQVCLFTATMPESLEQLAAGWLRRPEHVRVSASAACISRSVTQVVQVCAEHKKPAKLARHLRAIHEASAGLRQRPRVLVFVNRIKTCRFVHRLLADGGHRAALLHGERSQQERDAAVADFRSGKASVLVATDVAARGLHIRGLAYIVNYDFPPNLETYIHRVGRTGRLAADGHAFSFLTREMARLAPAVAQLLQQHAQPVDPLLAKLADAYETAARKLGLLAGALGEEQRAPQKEDVLRQLGMKTQQQKKRERQQQQRQQRRQAAALPGDGGASDSDGGSESDDGSQSDGGGEAGAAQPPAAGGTAPARPDFVASAAWAGARAGYAFKTGPRGLGYYADGAQRGGPGRPAGARARAASAAKQQQQAEAARLRRQYRNAPIGGPAAQQRAAPPPPLLPGRLKELKRQRALAAAAGQLAGFSSDEEEGAAAAAPPGARHKALPGRLRKKLARERAARG